MPRGHFDFARDPIGYFYTQGTTNGTTSQQVLGGNVGLLAAGGIVTTAALRCEPGPATALGHPLLDEFSRAVLMTAKAAGTGSWSLVIEMSRNAGTNWQASARLNVAAIPTINTVGSVPVIVEQPLPESLLKANVVGVNDTVLVRALVTPGQAVAAIVTVALLLIPGAAASQASRGRALT